MTNTYRAYELAKERFAAIGVDTDRAIGLADRLPVSMHCWQADDVSGFENPEGSLTGGIQATGNYPGKARTPEELRADLEKAMSFSPGVKKVNIHAFYLEAGGKKVDRDEIEPEHFANWAAWAKELDIGLDFNPTFFSHPLSDSGFTMSSADPGVRRFWTEHCRRSRVVAEYLGRETGKVCYNNIWLPDGCKDSPADRFAPRARLAAALDEARAQKVDPRYALDSVESKLFGIGSEAYVVGSHEFYMGYAMKNNMTLTLDAGHFHPTEVISNKISALLLFVDKLLLHVSRPVRWDSDHVVTLDDELLSIAQEIVRTGAEDRVAIALDYFDASINRVAALAIGMRNMRKALLRAYLEPAETLKKAELEGDTTSVLALTEEYKSMPWSAVWDHYCETSGAGVGTSWLDEAKRYEKTVLSTRK